MFQDPGILLLEDGSLQILAASDGDSGIYRCVAENVAGSISHDTTLKVWGNLVWLFMCYLMQNITFYPFGSLDQSSCL